MSSNGAENRVSASSLLDIFTIVMNYPVASYGVSEGVFALQISDLQTSGQAKQASGNLTPEIEKYEVYGRG